ncbi:nitroreductase family protein [Roseateles toxinivorans]|uniref:Nitroreductase n=1 Tax=Roseateles toxinivorans TaxID=270368 RepID=A0A4R6QPC3_9BURK|nr:nitroreductase family protein [Roseateles toxinivorans]TDP72259.1 nitroreductase [Roseateles toxinivorans]
MNAYSQLLNAHRSIRQFKSEAIDPALVERICGDAIAGGSSSGNLNSLSIVLTRDTERKRHLYELHAQQDMVLQAPLAITFCADFYRTRRWLSARGARDNFNNLIGYHIAAFDAIIVAQNACLGFESEGLGICYMGTTLHSMQAIAEFLQLPPTCVPVTSIVVGHPAEDPPKRDRLPLSAILHDETYRRPSDAGLDLAFGKREVDGWRRYLSTPRIKALIDEHGIRSLAEFYTSKVKYEPELFQRDSQSLLRLLHASDFIDGGPLEETP